MTHREQEPKEKKTRSDAQLWSRREKIEKQIVELQAEHSHISEILKGKLEP